MWQELILKADKALSSDGYVTRKAAPNAAILATQEAVKNHFNVELPSEYIDFLNHKNGFGFEGLVIYSAIICNIGDKQPDHFYKDIVEANEIWRDYEEHAQYLFYADSDLYLYGQNLITNEYEEQDRHSSDVTNNYPTFNDMISDAISKILEGL